MIVILLSVHHYVVIHYSLESLRVLSSDFAKAKGRVFALPFYCLRFALAFWHLTYFIANSKFLETKSQLINLSMKVWA